MQSKDLLKLVPCAAMWVSAIALPSCSTTESSPSLGARAGSAGAMAGSGGSSGAPGSAGNAASAGSAGAAGGAGAGGSNSVVDPGSDVRFDWPETVPGGQTCKPGRYEGTYECTYRDADGGGGFPVGGFVNLTLVESQSGEFLEIRDGRLDGNAVIAILFAADITGKLNCPAADFQGQLSNGVFGPLGLPTGTFHGPLQSSYDRTTFEFVRGTWNLTVDGAGGSCVGTWTAKFIRP